MPYKFRLFVRVLMSDYAVKHRCHVTLLPAAAGALTAAAD